MLTQATVSYEQAWLSNPDDAVCRASWIVFFSLCVQCIPQTNIYQKHDAELVRTNKRGEVEEELRVQVSTDDVCCDLLRHNACRWTS